MKILDTCQFIFERVKVKPITNAEWEKVQKEYKEFKDLSFTKDYITCGTIVMTVDKTLSVYFDNDIAKKMANFFHLDDLNEGEYFLCVKNINNWTRSYVCMSSYNYDLTNQRNHDVDIIRIYTNPLTIDEIKTLKTNTFYPILFDFAENRSYIERD